ncbi:uncharacterized protein LOC131425221 [Malaya genurostris]|uniref:uncharacterized protein LOC131425221 n=1 Tax=Malaya genurostris TaxID=325434 RepID=UPI0026F3B2E2|nr:uncharacterized protein LOC131425221 [Malaya genurostris]
MFMRTITIAKNWPSSISSIFYTWLIGKMHRLSIECIPNEIFEKIIAYLNIEDRKVAALVSKRWEKFAFSRIALTDISLEINCSKHSARDYWSVLEKSCRGYKNIVLKFSEDVEKYLLKILDKFQSSLEHITIEQDVDARILRTEISPDYFIQLMNKLFNVKYLLIKTKLEITDEVVENVKIPLLLKLETISFYTHGLEKDWIDWPNIAPNLKNIGFPLEDGQTGFPSVIDHFMKQILHLSIDARFIERDQLKFCLHSFPLLHKLRVLFPINNLPARKHVIRFIQSCSFLTEISLFDNFICRETLQVIAKHCTQMRIISLDANQVPTEIFAILSQLTCLKQLILQKMTVDSTMIIMSGYFTTLEQLTCLSVRFDNPDAFFENLHKRRPRLFVLELLDRFRFGINNFNQNGVVQAVCKNLINLRQLSVVDWAILDTSIFNWLSKLDKLVELRLKCIGINANKSIMACTTIKKVILDADSLKPTDVIPPVNNLQLEEVISKGFPCLKSLELRKAFLDKTMFSELQVEKLRKSIPSCIFYRKNRLRISNTDYAALM